MARRHYVGWFLVPFAIQAVVSRALPDWAMFESPAALFTIVVIAAGLCAVMASVVLAHGFRSGTAELVSLGLFFLSVSVLPLVHGITTPGVLYGDNTATMASVFWGVLVGAIAASPSLAYTNSALRYGLVAKYWRVWAWAWIVIIGAVAAVMLVAPNLIPMPDPLSPLGLAVIGMSVAASMVYGWRHVALAQIADSRAPLAISAGYALVAGACAVFLGAAPYSGSFWLAHAIDIVGVFLALITAFVVYRRTDSVARVLAPVVAVEPVAALEVGLEPEVVAFVADLERKDQITRDHVVRTAELAVQVTAELRLPPSEQRRAGLVGALHDIGKLRIPDEILNKPGALDDQEFATMRRHAEHGGGIVAGCVALADLAPAVRAHHERIAGAGYPDGLAGDDIPLVARVVSACDGFDAMAHTRQYREGMDLDKVFGILREHAGAQWDPQIVEALIRVVTSRGEWETRLMTKDRLAVCDCVPHGLEPTPPREHQHS